MKKTLLKGILCMAVVASMASCGETDEPGVSTRSGKISPAVEIDATVSSSRASRAEVSEVGVDDLAVKLTSADGSQVSTWESLAEFPVDQDFAVGSYTFEVSYGDISTEGFGAPYLHGSQTIKVEENKTTPVAVTASLANSMVSINYSENLKSYMTSWSASLHSAGGQYIDFVQDETRAAYVKPGNVEVYVDYVKPNGKGAKLKAATFTAVARTHYTVTIDLKEGAGVATLVISFDESTNEQPVEIELNDELESAPAPTIEAVGFDPATTVEFIPGGEVSPLKLNIIAKGMVGSVKMTTVSTSLVNKGWPAEIDLMAATVDQQNTLKSLGFDAHGIFNNQDKMAVIDMTNVLKNIKLLASGDNTSTFTFLVEDKFGKVSEPLTLSVIAVESTLELSVSGDLAVGVKNFDMDLKYNAGNPTGIVTIQYYNERGTWTDLPVVYTEKSAGVYTATVTAPDVYSNLRLRAKLENRVSPEVTVNRTGGDVTPSVDDVNVYAKYALVNASYDTKGNADVDANAVLAASEVMVSTDGATFTKATASYDSAAKQFNVTGLNPGTAYTVKIGIPGFDTATAPAATLTTEAATQLPNSDMETWFRDPGETDYWWVDYPGADKNAVWGTLNLLTTSVGDGSTNMFSHKGTSYCAFSGTRYTEDKHSGSRAAIISTVGWGDNDANGSVNVGKGCKNLTVGELYLGSYDASTQKASYTGWAMASRPSSMTFYYKYTVKNSADYGYAEIQILDASSNVIASGSLNLNATGTYTQQTIALNYTAKAKAALVKVVFKSSNNPACQTITNDNLSSPSFGNLSDGRFTGSELYIDDIVLTY